MRPESLDARDLYRLPWSFSDNVISWLEPTKECSITCEGCRSVDNPGGHKTFDRVAADLDVFEKHRRTDAVSIAGGDPLTHPLIPQIVRLVADRGLKPIVNTNGYALTKDLLRELKRQGLKGLTFHIDSGQGRPGWTGKSELELNELRLRCATMAAEAGDLSCAFNATVYEHTLKDVPALAEWAARHIDIVHVMVFIAFRLPYGKDGRQRAGISSKEIIGLINDASPGTVPSAYLNGAEQPDALKWLLTARIGDGERIYGSAGPKLIELAQAGNHLLRNRYLGYLSPKVNARAKALLALAPLDGGLRGTLKAWLKACLSAPRRLFRRLHMQTIMIIQPADIPPDGRQVWSCRLMVPARPAA